MSQTDPGKPGIISIQNGDGVTVGYVKAADTQVRTSTTVEAPDTDAVPAVEADKKARINTLWGVAAASKANDDARAAEIAASDTVYVVDDEYQAAKVGGLPVPAPHEARPADADVPPTTSTVGGEQVS